MAQLPDSLSDSRRFMAWAGSASDLLPILEAMERQFADQRASHLDARTSFYRAEVERHQKALAKAQAAFARRHPNAASGEDTRDSLVSMYSQLHGSALSRLQEAEVEAEKFDEVAVTLRSKRGQGTRRTRGRPSEIVDYLTHLDVRELEFETPAGSGTVHRVSVRFDGEGVRITASSTDSRWTSAAMSQVAEAVRRRVPWWRWMRSLWFLIPMLGAASVFLLATVISAVPKGVVDDGVLTLGFFGGLWVLTPLAVWVATKALPPFELTASERPTGARVFYLLGSTLVSFVLDVVVNLVS